MFVEERRKVILDILKEKKSVSVREMSNVLNVSLPTIRSDLDHLEKEKLLIRTHGGAVLDVHSNQDYTEQSFETRTKINIEKKQNIASKAIGMIHPKDCIILDSSSTSYGLAKLLRNTKENITVLTNGINIASLLKENLNLTVIIIGGILSGKSNAVQGLLGQEILDKMNVDKVFFSAYGVSIEHGFSDFNLYESELKRRMLNSSFKKIALMDSTKMNKYSSSSFAKLSDVSMIITDNDIDPSILKEYSQYVNIVV
ncbi:DeoR/GlpR family DNA-binding transcription regulator [Heyndrickxia acidiproducens]|uniref:DeoR/GlpR family DNA-binding transcription regulator n=1 Tax=Heyndrickxia acidiproducens TaxID=1121084 RepID=UPI00036E9104|nr:DeoR/GlpR family DNA-binding transcription regulator [Heyndrickxia acidiproducens]